MCNISHTPSPDGHEVWPNLKVAVLESGHEENS